MLIAPDYSKLGTQGFQDLVKSWAGDTSKARAYTERYGYSPAQMASFYNEGATKPITKEEAAGLLGVDPMKANVSLGKAYETQDPKTGAFKIDPTAPENFSNYSVDPNDPIANAPAPSQISDKDFAINMNNYLADKGNVAGAEGVKQYMKRFNLSVKDITDKYNAGAGTNLTYEEAAKQLGLSDTGGIVAPSGGGIASPGGGTPAGTGFVAPGITDYNLPKFDEIEPYEPAKESLASYQLEQILSKDNPLMQSRYKAGEREAQRKGLLSSSLGGEYAQKALYDVALPLAQQDAKTFADAAMASYQGKLQQGLSEQDAIQKDYLSQRNLQLQGMISSGLSSQEAEQNLTALEKKALIDLGLSETEAEQTMAQLRYDAGQKKEQLKLQNLLAIGLSEKEAAQAINLDLQRQKFENYRTDLELSLKRELTNVELTAAEKEIVANGLRQYGQNFQEAAMNIQIQNQLSEETKSALLNQQQQLYNSNMQTLATLYGIEISWDTGVFEAPVEGEEEEEPMPKAEK